MRCQQLQLREDGSVHSDVSRPQLTSNDTDVENVIKSSHVNKLSHLFKTLLEFDKYHYHSCRFTSSVLNILRT